VLARKVGEGPEKSDTATFCCGDPCELGQVANPNAKPIRAAKAGLFPICGWITGCPEDMGLRLSIAAIPK